MKRRRKINGPFVALPKAIKATEAWRAMSPGARLLWLELRGMLRNYGSNNGKQFLACRDAAKAIGTKSTRSIVRWYAENEHYGFLRKTAEGFLGGDGYGLAAKYRFTDLAYGTHPPNKEYEKWDGELFSYSPRRGGRKKQNPVSLGDTPRVPEGHIRKANGTNSVCAPEGHIGEAPKCAPEGHISRLPSESVAITGCEGDAGVQGSSTVRAPAQAGDAGSSPAPVAKPDLTTMVLDIVTAQLNELESRRQRAAACSDGGCNGQRRNHYHRREVGNTRRARGCRHF